MRWTCRCCGARWWYSLHCELTFDLSVLLCKVIDLYLNMFCHLAVNSSHRWQSNTSVATSQLANVRHALWRDSLTFSSPWLWWSYPRGYSKLASTRPMRSSARAPKSSWVSRASTIVDQRRKSCCFSSSRWIVALLVHFSPFPVFVWQKCTSTRCDIARIRRCWNFCWISTLPYLSFWCCSGLSQWREIIYQRESSPACQRR